jgi:DNA-directed RNA polymerase subunit RPC12/RpoP
LEDVLNEDDKTINRSHTLKGKIISIQKNNNQYTCQGCGRGNMIDENKIISCNNCHSRLIKNPSIDDNYLKIMILIPNNEEYNLKIPKALMIPLLNINDSCPIDNNHSINNEINFNDLINTNIQFTYSEVPGTISDMSTFTQH